MKNNLDVNETVSVVESHFDDITYLNYSHNRDVSPRFNIDEWRPLYPDIEALERRYQQEKYQIKSTQFYKFH